MHKVKTCMLKGMGEETYMHEDQPGNKTESLTVSSLRVSHCIGMENVVQFRLPCSLQTAGEVGVGGEGPT